MDNEKRLLDIASAQQGYFTSRQAEQCGYLRSNFHYKIRSGKWQKEMRGIYRLSSFPSLGRPELSLWTLWSAGKDGVPQGIFSHETALEIHGLSDVAPAKLHMSVPKGFRRGGPIPKHLSLHFVDPISDTEVEIREGYRVTKPLRTLADIIEQGTTNFDQIELAILDLAAQKALLNGLITLIEMEKLHECTGSLELRNIIARAIEAVWTHANTELERFGRLVEPYTIGLSFNRQAGTAVLCHYRSHYFLLTASHVTRHFGREVTLIPYFDAIRREYAPYQARDFVIKEWDPAFREEQITNILRDQPKDLAIVILPDKIVHNLKQFKAFYEISEEPGSFSLKDAFVLRGGTEVEVLDDGRTIQFNSGPYGLVAANYHQHRDKDYIILPASNSTHATRKLGQQAQRSFQGLSGGGLWKFKGDIPSLVGIVIAEDQNYSARNGMLNVYAHGPHSIREMCAQLERLQ